jgi:serine/threonine-protein kinase HipA
MNRKAKVLFEDKFAGILYEDENGYVFEYDDEYVKNNFPAISLTLPISKKRHESKTMFPFFDGLIPEGWLLNLAVENWKLDPRDRMGLLLTVCRDNIGAVGILPLEENINE